MTRLRSFWNTATEDPNRAVKAANQDKINNIGRSEVLNKASHLTNK